MVGNSSPLSTASPEDFLHRHVAALHRKLHRIGVSASFGLSEAGIEAAFERVTPAGHGRELLSELKSLGS
ncbi:MAG TPA: hypothetical protein VFQ61_12470 [Polyangiaceae bacterium]|nr:hypothetical protein [Polyangiaceae bacterium]